MRFADQALYHAFVRTQDAGHRRPRRVPVRERRGEGAREGALLRASSSSSGTTSSRGRRPSSTSLVKYLNEVLNQFFTVELPPMLGELSWEVVKEAKLADARTGAGYKISASAFPTFRSAFERRFLQRLVPFVEDEMLSRVRDSDEPVPLRDDPVRRRPRDLQRRVRGGLRVDLRHALQRRLPRLCRATGARGSRGESAWRLTGA